MRAYAEEVEAVSRRLFAEGVIISSRRSVGPWFEGDHTWAVTGPDGAPEVLAHDIFTVALWFVRLEAGDVVDGLPPGGLRIPTEAEATKDAEERRHFALAGEFLTMMIDDRRARAAGVRT